MVNRKKIKELKKVALSQSQLQSHTTKHIPILTYDEIYGKSFEELTENGACILLYLIEENYGHWTALVRIPQQDEPDHMIYFDSYAEYPDQPLMWSSPETNEELGQSDPYLLENIVANPDQYEYYSNPFAFQNEDDTSIQTCGRHVLCFLEYCWRASDPSLLKYKEWLDEMKEETGLETYDQVVTYLTGYIS